MYTIGKQCHAVVVTFDMLIFQTIVMPAFLSQPIIPPLPTVERNALAEYLAHLALDLMAILVACVEPAYVTTPFQICHGAAKDGKVIFEGGL